MKESRAKLPRRMRNLFYDYASAKGQSKRFIYASRRLKYSDSSDNRGTACMTSARNFRVQNICEFAKEVKGY